MSDKLSAVIYGALIEEIVNGVLKPGQIITEKSLMDRFHYSKSPIREALVRLCFEDVLDSIPRCGYQLKAYDLQYLEQIVDYRRLVEPTYLRRYFDTLSDADIRRIQDTLVDLTLADFPTPAKFWQVTSRFHLALAESYHDSFFYTQLQRALRSQLIAFSLQFRSNWGSPHVTNRTMAVRHKGILEAIAAGDCDAACAILEKDICFMD